MHNHNIMTLIELGANCNTRRSDGTTLLHAAASMGHVACAGLLLTAGADPNAVAANDATPLHLCATGFTLFGSQKGKAEVAALLLGRHANRGPLDAQGRSPLVVAKEDIHSAFVAQW